MHPCSLFSFLTVFPRPRLCRSHLRQGAAVSSRISRCRLSSASFTYSLIRIALHSEPSPIRLFRNCFAIAFISLRCFALCKHLSHTWKQRVRASRAAAVLTFGSRSERSVTQSGLPFLFSQPFIALVQHSSVNSSIDGHAFTLIPPTLPARHHLSRSQ